MAKKSKPQAPPKGALRSRQWFDDPDNPGHDRALSRALSQLRPDARKSCARASRSSASRRPAATSSPCNRHHLELAERVREGIRDAGGIAHRVPRAPDPGNRQAPDRRARPQPRLSRPGRDPVRLSDRRRRADHRLRQDDAGRADGGRDREHSRHRALGRADARRLVRGRARRLGHDHLEGARSCSPPGEIDYRGSSSSSPRRRRRPGTATRWAPPRP